MSQARRFESHVMGDQRPAFQAALRSLVLVLPLLLGLAPDTRAQVSVGVGIDVPGVSIGINLPIYPDLQPVPGYPVYYAPQAAGNYFYHDGLYWVFQGDNWYASSWYNGPWRSVMPLYVPAYVLRVPVQYYRHPPPYFRHWRADAPPRWDHHWGRDWHQRRPGWDHGDRRAAPPLAPLPTYQRRYPQSRYPLERDQQQMIREQNVKYPPRERVSREDHPWPDRKPSHPQGRPGQRVESVSAPAPMPRVQTPSPPRAGPNAQSSARPPNRPPAAQPAHAPRPQAAPHDRGRPQGRAQGS